MSQLIDDDKKKAKQEATDKLFAAEEVYLQASGWVRTTLVLRDRPSTLWTAPPHRGTYRFSHERAVKMQKVWDDWPSMRSK